MSITKVGSPTAAKAVPRLMAVVVLPTPPFWLATTRMRGFLGCDMTGAQFSHNHYRSRRIGLTWYLRGLDVPIFMGIRQFDPYILALQEQANAVQADKILGIGQELGEGRQSPGRHHVKSLAG